jgi:hypothetical protein
MRGKNKKPKKQNRNIPVTWGSRRVASGAPDVAVAARHVEMAWGQGLVDVEGGIPHGRFVAGTVLVKEKKSKNLLQSTSCKLTKDSRKANPT